MRCALSRVECVRSEAARLAFALTMARPSQSAGTVCPSAAARPGKRGQNVGQDRMLYKSAALLLRG